MLRSDSAPKLQGSHNSAGAVSSRQPGSTVRVLKRAGEGVFTVFVRKSCAQKGFMVSVDKLANYKRPNRERLSPDLSDRAWSTKDGNKLQLLTRATLSPGRQVAVQVGQLPPGAYK